MLRTTRKRDSGLASATFRTSDKNCRLASSIAARSLTESVSPRRESGSRRWIASISAVSRRSSPLLCGPKRRVSITRNPGWPVDLTVSTISSNSARNPGFASSQRHVRKPNAVPRASMDPPIVSAVGVVCAIPLFSTTKSMGSLTCCGNIKAFINQPLAESAVAYEDCDNPAAIALLPCPSESRSDRSHAGLHAITVKMAVSQMLASADSPAHTPLAAHDFGDQPGEIARISKKMPVIPVIR